MPTAIKITAGNESLTAELNDTLTAQAIVAALPFDSSASRWGDEYYFSVDVHSNGDETPKRDVFSVGELGFWEAGNAFCIFFGPTPVSQGTEPRMANPGIPIGRVRDDILPLMSMGPRVPMKVELA
ncbi:cyclophilin-like fold protein [Planctomycetaceae bacterium]|jgi:uncharacterized protein|nr:cyclophilin-like fold protein [bacterium]MDC0262119.1 cyclophilin-like fold protein [Planctomycetaceae bacterium]MDC0273338.1 cyclophilin-like fold protein [Planctomycetaceae bacterium]MDC0307941.1 cyclophilin-like fold protein [Planctomycetaceae bacterium]MDG2391852.1 cyclophilin-like fold protein [Planctomycetaceae bacterium]